MSRNRIPTCTFLVLEALRGSDDFMNRAMLMAATGYHNNQVDAATHHLRKRHAIDCVVEPDGGAWWYAMPPESDDRSRTCDLRTPEAKPRKARRVATGVYKRN